MKMVSDKKTMLTELLMSISASGCAVVISPAMMRIAVGQNQNVMTMTVGAAVCFLGVLILTVILFYRKAGSGGIHKARKGEAVKKAMIFFVIFAMGILCISLLNGILAVGLHSMLQRTLSLSQIKGIINYTGAALSLTALPAGISLFWTSAQGGSPAAAAKRLKHSYVKLLILCLLLFAIGMLVMTACNHLTSPAMSQTAATILLGAAGFAGLLISEQICREDAGGEQR